MIASGSIHTFYLSDVAQAINLDSLQAMLGPSATQATVQDKSPGPQKVRYQQPPLVIDGASLGVGSIDEFKVRLKFYDYGVISLMLSQPFSGSWADLVRIGQDLIESEPLEQHAIDASRLIVDRVAGALELPRRSFLTEDYVAVVVNRLEQPLTADEVVARHGADIAQLLRGERQALSDQERDEVLRHRLSYLTDDLVVPAYNAAFVYDSEAGGLSTLEILEYVNSHLLEFRYHDELLEAELARIYADLQRRRRAGWFLARRPAKAMHSIHAVFIDVNELTDRMENALKLVGDVYAARLFGLAASRVGLDAWKRNVEEKLVTLNDIHRFTVEQSHSSRANLLELVIVLILVIEFGFFVADLAR